MPKTLTANDLRWLGEEADGRRGEDYALVWEDEALKFVGLKDLGARKATLLVRTEFEGEGMNREDARVKIVLSDEEIDPNTGPDPIDAVFLTQGAVEKFVVPYYTRMVELDEIARLRTECFGNKRVVAVAHVRPSVWKPVKAQLIPIALKDDGKLELLNAISFR